MVYTVSQQEFLQSDGLQVTTVSRAQAANCCWLERLQPQSSVFTKPCITLKAAVMNDHINHKQILLFSFEEVEGMKFCHLCTIPKMLSVVKQGRTTFSLSVFSLSPREPFLSAYRRISTVRMARLQKSVLGSYRRPLKF